MVNIALPAHTGGIRIIARCPRPRGRGEETQILLMIPPSCSRVTRRPCGRLEGRPVSGVLLTGRVSPYGLEVQLHILVCWAHRGVSHACKSPCVSWGVAVDEEVPSLGFCAGETWQPLLVYLAAAACEDEDHDGAEFRVAYQAAPHASPALHIARLVIEFTTSRLL